MIEAAAAALAMPAGPAPAISQLATKLSAVDATAPTALKAMKLNIETSLDPRLQLCIANRRTGKQGLMLASTGGNEIAVIARVTSVDDWTNIPDVLPGSALGKAADGASWIVTGRIPVARIEAVKADPAVISLKASQPVRPALASTIEKMGVAPTAMPAGTNPDGGSRCLIGIVDFGCDFAHRNFRLANGKSRVRAIWHQAGVAAPDSPFGYGRLHKKGAIDAALTTLNPYAALGYGPAPDNAFQTGTHGTHVMDIAAGNGRGSGQAGVAPKADIIFVEASSNDIAWDGPDSVGQAFGDSVQLLEAVRFIFDTAGTTPCVVNLSLGTNGGPHDGTSLVEQGLDALVNEKPNRAVAIAASNSQDDGIHTMGTVPAAATHDIVLQQPTAGGGEFELWYAGARRLEVSVVGSDGTVFGPVAPGDTLPIGNNGQIVIFISNRLNDPNNHDNMIGVWIAEGLSSDDWTIRLRSLDNQPVDYHAWIERNDAAQASFAAPVGTHTLGSISTGHQTIVVGSYDAHKPAMPLSSFSSAGPTRDGRNKPELSAPGHQVLAARSRTGSGVTRKSGTSMATPAVSGLVALIYSEARRNNRDLTIEQLRDKLMAGLLLNPPAMAAGGWDTRYGSGRASGGSIPDGVV